MPLEEKIQLRKVQLCDLHVEPITEIPHKLSDICNVWILEENKMYGNIKKVHIIVIQCDEFLHVWSKVFLPEMSCIVILATKASEL